MGRMKELHAATAIDRADAAEAKLAEAQCENEWLRGQLKWCFASLDDPIVGHEAAAKQAIDQAKAYQARMGDPKSNPYPGAFGWLQGMYGSLEAQYVSLVNSLRRVQADVEKQA